MRRDIEAKRIAILLATYNGEKYLQEQLESIHNQTYSNWNLIVSDDGSSDGTIDLVLAFAEMHPGKVELANRNEGISGACGNFFHLMRHAVGMYDYYSFCDQDDWWDSRKLQCSVEMMRKLEEANPNSPALVFTDAEVVDDKLRRIDKSFFRYTDVDPSRTKLAQLLVQNPISGAGILMNKSVVVRALKSPTLEDIDMHDQWVGLVASAFGCIAWVDGPTYKYRQHVGNAIGANEMSLGTVVKKAKRAKTSLEAKERQASKFLQVYEDELDCVKVDLLRGFSKLSCMSKSERIRFLIKHGSFQNGVLRNLGLLIAV